MITVCWVLNQQEQHAEGVTWEVVALPPLGQEQEGFPPFAPDIPPACDTRDALFSSSRQSRDFPWPTHSDKSYTVLYCGHHIGQLFS